MLCWAVALLLLFLLLLLFWDLARTLLSGSAVLKMMEMRDLHPAREGMVIFVFSVNLCC